MSSTMASSSSAAVSACPSRRPKGLWKARGTHPTRWANHAPENNASKPRLHHLFADDHLFDHDHHDHGADSDNSDDSYFSYNSKRPRFSHSPPTDDDDVLYWDYSRKCSPHPERLDKWTTRSKLMDTSSTAGPGKSRNPLMSNEERQTCDLEDWEDLKELFGKAAEIYEVQSPAETLPLLRGVIHECHRFLIPYEDPSVLYATPPSPVAEVAPSTSPPQRVYRNWSDDNPPLYPPPGYNKPKVTQGTQTAAVEKEKKCKCKDLPTAFYTILGTTLFFFGNLIEACPELAMPGEPSSPVPYWLNAIDVFEIGENLPIRTSGKGCQSAPEDWRMAIIWGRTLVSIVNEMLRRRHADPSPSGPSTAATTPNTPPVYTIADYGFPGIVQAMMPIDPTALNQRTNESLDTTRPVGDRPRWPPNSPFGLIAARRPPVTTPLSLATDKPHDLLIFAQDQFSRGILHMPHPLHSQRSRVNPFKLASVSDKFNLDLPASFTSTPPFRPHLLSKSSSSSTSSTSSASTAVPSSSSSGYPLTPSPGTTTTVVDSEEKPERSSNQPPETFSRVKELFTIASEVLNVAEKLDAPSEREHWSSYADTVFSQMKMELADLTPWNVQISSGRGRCQLVLGTARLEELEERIEAEDPTVWDCEAAIDARDALTRAVEFLETARDALLEEQKEAEQNKGKVTPTQDSSTIVMIDESTGQPVELDADDEDGEGMRMSVVDVEADALEISELEKEKEREEEIAELSKLLGEALLDLANLTRDKAEQDKLYARAVKIGGDAIVLDEDSESDDGMDESF